MHPGMACNACHQQLGGPALRIAGTVYPTLREPDDCQGSGPPPPLEIVITDSRNKEFRVPVNGSGNFQSLDKVKPPYRAEVVGGGKVRKMSGTVTSGDCNSCHTLNGKNSAP